MVNELVLLISLNDLLLNANINDRNNKVHIIYSYGINILVMVYLNTLVLLHCISNSLSNSIGILSLAIGISKCQSNTY